MKKQILILVCLVMATFATTNVFGQGATHFSSPKASVGCANDALRPMAGKPYDYIVSSNDATPKYTWWATTTPTFMTAGVLQSTITANVLGSPAVIPTTALQYNTPANTSGTIQLTWGTDVLANAMKTVGAVPAFVAVYSNGAGCADNLKVFQVNPINAFMVDIKNIDNAKVVSGVLLPADTLTYAGTESQCYDKVQGATWANDKMTYDYGTNILYFEVVASNFTGKWKPTFTLSGLQAGQSAGMVWAYTPAFGTPVLINSGTATADVTTTATNTTKGVSIFVKVTVSNTTWEGITAGGDPITLVVSGVNSANQVDVKSSDCTLADINTVTQNLNARPIISESTDTGTFEQP